MTKVTKAQVVKFERAQNKVRIDMVRGNRNYFVIYGICNEQIKIGGKKVWQSRLAWNRATKAEAAEMIAKYGLTMEEFITIDSGDYEIEDEIDPAEYAVSVEAQEIALDAEIEQAEKKSEEVLITAVTAINRNYNGGAYAWYRKNFKSKAQAFKYLWNKRRSYKGTTEFILKIEVDGKKVFNFDSAARNYALAIKDDEIQKLYDDAQTIIAAENVIAECKNFIEMFNNHSECYAKAKKQEMETRQNKIRRFLKKQAEKIDAATNSAEVSNAEIISCLEDYIVDADAAAEVEEENEIENRLAETRKRQEFIAGVLNMGDMESGKEIKLIPQAEEGTRPTWLTARKMAFNDFTYRKMSDDLYHIRILREGREALSTVATYETEEQVQEVIHMLGAAIQRGDESFTFQTVEEVKAQAATEISTKKFQVQYLLGGYGDGENHKKEFADYDEAKNFLKNLRETESTYTIGNIRYGSSLLWTVRAGGKDYGNGCPKELEKSVEESKKPDAVKAKIAEIVNRPRKKIIDWTATLEEMQTSEILHLQKDLKKFLKLGELDLAENIFSMLKILCKNYREKVAA